MSFFDKIVIYVILGLPFPVNIVFTALTLVPLCCRACGYNLCMKTCYRKALREILPLFILIVPSFLFIVLLISSIFEKFLNALYSDILYSILGLFCALSFALHLCFIRKNLKKLRSKKRTLGTTNYKSVNLRRTHHTTAYTSEGISETCNTECPLLSENEEDTRFLLKKNNRVQ